MIAVMIQTMKLNEINLEESEKNKRDSYVDASKSAFAPLFRSSASFLIACLQRKVAKCVRSCSDESRHYCVHAQSCVVRLEADVSSSFRTHNTQTHKEENYQEEL